LDTNNQSDLVYLFIEILKAPVHQTFKMVADANDDSMFNSSDERKGLLGNDRVVACRECGVNM
ncbi:MAG: hypothetical protein P8X68_17560, partial [Desulfobacterales bacterium]